MKNDIAFLDCKAELYNNVLTVQNSKIRRTWLITDAGIVPKSLTDMITGEVLTENNEENINPTIVSSNEKIQKLVLEGAQENDYGFAKEHLKCRLTLFYSQFSLQYEVVIYPSLPIIRTRTYIKGTDNIYLKEFPTLDIVAIQEKHCEWETVFMRAVTDSHNNLVQTEEGLFYLNESSKLSGNILRIHRTLQNDGIVFIKESPAVDEQVRYGGYDFTIADKKITVHSAGFLSSDIMTDEFIPIYGSAVCLYHGNEFAFYQLLRDYHEARHFFNKIHDGAVISNTWGDDSGGKNIQEEFVQEELDIAHDIGITHYQIDAGWDKGERNDMGACTWEVKYSAFPYGFERIRGKMAKFYMTLGIWFEPYTDDGNNYAYYRQDAKTLIDLYHNHGVIFFKLDGFKLLNYTATYRFEKMLQLVLAGTGNSVFFDVDITNWPRTGMFGATQYSNMFLENRYTDRISYYPHYVLRNIWMISKYIPTYRIQTEFLNIGRNAGLYEADESNDPLAPICVGQEYAVASVLFASPLAWLETTKLGEESRKSIKRLLNATKDVRADILSSHVLPIGDIPNGTHYTGFQSIKDEHSGYLLLLKEVNDKSSHEYQLYMNGLNEKATFTKIISNCNDKICVTSDSKISVAMDHNFSFAIYQYKL